MRSVSRWILAGVIAAAPLRASAADLNEFFKGQDPQAPGCVVGVAQKDHPAAYAAYGSADLEHAAPNTLDTIMEAGSVAKQFTATAILMLVEEGKIALTDDIRKYLPEMPDYGTPITVNHLLTHTSGLRDWGEVAALAGWPRSYVVRTNLEVLEIASRQTALNYKPGDAYSYTNTGYNLAAFIVERVSGQSLPDFTRDRIFVPLGMTKTSWRDDFRRVVPNRAIAYLEKTTEDYRQEMPFEDNYGHGGLLTTAHDLLTWNEALTSRKLGEFVTTRLEEQAVLNSGRKIAYARGLVQGTYNGVPEISHGGGTASYRTWLARYPSLGASVAVLCNGASINAAKIGRESVAYLRPVSETAAAPAKTNAKAAKIPSVEASQLPGLYIDELTGRSARIVARDGALKLAGTAQSSAREADLIRLAARRYRNGAAEITFKDGVMESHVGDGEITSYRKVDPYAPPVPELEALASRYFSAEAGGTLLLSVKGGSLILMPADRPSAATALTPLSRDVYRNEDGLITVVRNQAGAAEGLRFTYPRVYSLVFGRIADQK